MGTRRIGGVPSDLMVDGEERRNGETESLKENEPHPRFTSKRGEEYWQFVIRARKTP